MIKLNVVAVGKLKERFFTDAVNEYAKRISRFASLKITEIPEKKTVEEEGTEILKKTSGLTVLTDVKGEAVSSENLAESGGNHKERLYLRTKRNNVYNRK